MSEIASHELGDTKIARDGHGISFGDALRVWVRIASLSFGGPAGQIAVMHRILVDEKRWIGENRFLHALNYCMLLPGPEAQHLAIYIGWLLHKTKGGLVAGILLFFRISGDIGAELYLRPIWKCQDCRGAVFGLKAAVLAVVLQAVARIGKRALKNNVMVLIAVAAFLAIFAFHVPFPLIILTGAASSSAMPQGRAGYSAVPSRRRPRRLRQRLADRDSALKKGRRRFMPGQISTGP